MVISCGPHAFGQRTLRHKLKLDLAGLVERFKNRRARDAREAANQLAHAPDFKEPRETDAPIPGIVGHDRENERLAGGPSNRGANDRLNDARRQVRGDVGDEWLVVTTND